jgi:hypothetical protein
VADEGDIAAVVALSVTASIGLFKELLPPLQDVRRADPHDKEFAEDVHVAMVGGFALVVGIGAIMAQLTNSHIALSVSILLAAGIALLYERALRMRGAQ